VAREFNKNTEYEILQGRGKTKGKLIGGCLEVIEYIKGTSLFPEVEIFDETILFLETSEVMPPIWFFEDSLRNYGSMGILNRVNGIIFGKPQGNQFYEEYKTVIKEVLAEFGKDHMPVLYNASFGHNEPKCCIPYGVLAEIDCDEKTFSILESAVI
jgi:muramoyltetrapeptide carboxypeptidase LdcA involved in peptidoglycan recycling